MLANRLVMASFGMLCMLAFTGCSTERTVVTSTPNGSTVTTTTTTIAPTPKVTWSADVDDAATINFQGGKSWIDNVSAKGVDNAVTVFHEPLPSSPVTVTLTLNSGRGQVTVVKQPTKENNFTAAVRVIDSEAGKSHYDFGLTW